MKGIYCIDDDEIITSILKFQLDKILPKNVFIVEIFNDPLLVLDTLKLHSTQNIDPTLLIVDFQMPNLRGDELVRSVKKELPHIKIIMLSGNSNAILVSELEEDGLLDFYHMKPWESGELVNSINKCLPLNLKIF